MPEVIALHSFKHNGESRARNAEWDASEKDALALQRAGLVKIKGGAQRVAVKKPAAKKVAARNKPAATKPATKAEPKPGSITA